MYYTFYLGTRNAVILFHSYILKALFIQFSSSFDRNRIFTDDDDVNSCAQYLITIDTSSATFGDLSHIINFEVETICVKFGSHTGTITILNVARN